MEISSFKENPSFPFLLIDNFYDKKEEELIWKELDFYSINKFMSSDEDKTGARGVDKTGKGKVSSYRIYLDLVYKMEARHISNILTVYKKIISKDVKEAYKKTTPAWVLLDSSSNDFSMIQYYDEGDYYKSHTDAYGCTVIIWFYREPKRFKGGDFILDDPNEKIECKHNRLIMFPSFYMHSVTPVIMEKEHRGKGLGRYSLTHFYFRNNTLQWNTE